ncbi:MAG: beta-phosphoglucomutase [Anaerolineae bacterium]|nr:beta-phosphoglucomutase [Anaerolineae bacterium]NUQ06104.1 glycoside hydrolase family 65 protein [Anaerolineae bacterium]
MQKRLWTLIERGFQAERLHQNETLFTIGNGYLGVRGTFEEGYPGATPATLIHGIYDHVPSMQIPELVNAPNWLPIAIMVDGTPFTLRFDRHDSLNPPHGALLGYERALLLDRAVLHRSALFRAASGSIVRLTFDRFASLADEHIMAQRVTITAVAGEPVIAVAYSIDADTTNDGVSHWAPDVRTSQALGTIGVERRTAQSGYGVAVTSCVSDPHAVRAAGDALRPALTSVLRLDPTGSAVFDKFSALYTSRDLADPLDAAENAVRQAAAAGYDALLQAHTAAWAKSWAASDIRIEGDDECQLALRLTAYHVLIAAPRHDENVSIGAKTLSGLGYKGHVFWDVELFMLPPLTLTQPEVARNLLMYRYHRLAGARHKAQANGCEGAMFPWESTDTGEETTPQWSDPQPDGSRIRIWTGDREQHISTDIAYAVWQFWRWTGDDDWFRRCGAELLLDTAVFWGSRVEEKNGRYEISQQIGPDEYHENVDNSVFVNRMVVWHLQTALRGLDWLAEQSPDDHARLTTSLDLSAKRLARWRDIIARMFIPFDEAKQIHIQFPGFFDMEYIPVPHYLPRTHSVQAILGHARSIQSQVIKQADVVMLMALLGESLAPRSVLLNNWDTYFPRCDHGSSLSPAMHAWAAARLGLTEIAYDQFHHAVHIDLHDNKGNSRDGIHAAACGGVWQAVVFGFVGLHIDANGDLAFQPALPTHWKRVSFSVNYRGTQRTITVENPA